MAVLANEILATCLGAVLMRKQMKRLVGLLSLILPILFSAYAFGATCNQYWTSSLPVPTGFGASYDVFNIAHPLLESVDCTSPPNILLTVGTENSPNQAIYNTAYLSKDGVTWTAVQLSSTNQTVPNGYFQASATATLSLTTGDLNNWNYIAFLVAYYRNGAWVYGCPDTACTSPGWNLQAITTNTVQPNITSVSLSANTFLVTATAGENIATISATESFGAGVPTFALSTAGSCSGSPSADNGSFAVSGTSLNVGGSNLTAAQSWHICIAATDSGAFNSPYYQAFTLTSSAMGSIASVNISTTNFNTPAAGGTLLATVSASPSSGVSLNLSTAGSCAGSPSAENSDFTFSSPNLRVASGPALTAGTYNLCFAATGAFTNSPYYQAFTLTGSNPVSNPVPTAISPSSASIPDTDMAGAVVTPLTVTTSDSSPFSGTVTLTSNPGFLYSISGSAPNYSLVVATGGPGSAGSHTVTAQATENGTSVNQNITVTVTSATSTGCDEGPNKNSIPLPAQMAGFTTCALNADFTDNSGAVTGGGFVMNDTSTYIDGCSSNPSNLPAYHFYVTTFFSTVNSPCNRASIVSDPLGGGFNVLHLTFSAADQAAYNSNNVAAGCSGDGGANPPCTFALNDNEIHWPSYLGGTYGFPTEFYISSTVYIPLSSMNSINPSANVTQALSTPNGVGYASAAITGEGARFDNDQMEVYSRATNSGATSWCCVSTGWEQWYNRSGVEFYNANSYPTFNSIDPTSGYHQIEVTFTSDENPSGPIASECAWIDGIEAGCAGSGKVGNPDVFQGPRCNSGTWACYFGFNRTVLWIIAADAACTNNSNVVLYTSPCYSNPTDIYFKEISIFECANYKTTSCPGPVIYNTSGAGFFGSIEVLKHYARGGPKELMRYAIHHVVMAVERLAGWDSDDDVAAKRAVRRLRAAHNLAGRPQPLAVGAGLGAPRLSAGSDIPTSPEVHGSPWLNPDITLDDWGSNTSGLDLMGSDTLWPDRLDKPAPGNDVDLLALEYLPLRDAAFRNNAGPQDWLGTPN